MKTIVLFCAALAVAAPTYAQLPGVIRKGQEARSKADQVKETAGSFVFNDAEKAELGGQISAMLRDRFGVVQDRNVTKYVTLVGLTVAKNSSQPGVPWQFIVLDTDGINAYAAPGGFVHITRGALAFLQSEAELAGVLGHEIGHVIGNHTIEAIQKGKAVEVGANVTRNQFLQLVADKAFRMVFENAFDRGDEIDADKHGVTAAGKAGYNATSLTEFLNRLGERNKGNPDRNGLFASHPDLKARNDRIAKTAKDGKLAATALAAPRFKANVAYKPIPMSAIATVAPPASSAADARPADAKKPGLGLGSVKNALSTGSQRNSSQAVASAGARGVTPDRDAKGGPVKTAVKVSVTAAELASFKAGIS